MVRISLLGLYGYFDSIGEDLFSELTLPEGYNAETFKSTLFLDYGERGILYTNPNVFRGMIGAWSLKWALELSRLYKAMTEDYEPLWNIDRFEDVTDLENQTNNGTTSASTSGGDTSSTSGTTERQTSAFNSSSYEPHDKDVMSLGTNNTNTQSSSGTSNDTMRRGYEHDGHYYGNGGVTSSQSLVIEEVKLREKYNLYHRAAKLFADDLLLYID